MKKQAKECSSMKEKQAMDPNTKYVKSKAKTCSVKSEVKPTSSSTICGDTRSTIIQPKQACQTRKKVQTLIQLQ